MRRVRTSVGLGPALVSKVWTTGLVPPAVRERDGRRCIVRESLARIDPRDALAAMRCGTALHASNSSSTLAQKTFAQECTPAGLLPGRVREAPSR